jgi:hypothetical protein
MLKRIFKPDVLFVYICAMTTWFIFLHQPSAPVSAAGANQAGPVNVAGRDHEAGAVCTDPAEYRDLSFIDDERQNLTFSPLSQAKLRKLVKALGAPEPSGPEQEKTSEPVQEAGGQAINISHSNPDVSDVAGQHGPDHPAVFVQLPVLECKCTEFSLDAKISSCRERGQVYFVITIMHLVPWFKYELEIDWNIGSVDSGWESVVSVTTDTNSFTLREALMQRNDSLHSVWDVYKKGNDRILINVKVRDMYPGLTAEEALIGMRNIDSYVNKVQLKCVQQSPEILWRGRGPAGEDLTIYRGESRADAMRRLVHVAALASAPKSQRQASAAMRRGIIDMLVSRRPGMLNSFRPYVHRTQAFGDSLPQLSHKTAVPCSADVLGHATLLQDVSLFHPIVAKIAKRNPKRRVANVAERKVWNIAENLVSTTHKGPSDTARTTAVGEEEEAAGESEEGDSEEDTAEETAATFIWKHQHPAECRAQVHVPI